MPIINDDKNTLLIRCDCHYHVLEVSYDDEWEPNPIFSFSVWNQTPTPFSFKDRISLIWRLIQGKNLGGGDVVIHTEDIKSIINFLNKKLRKTHVK